MFVIQKMVNAISLVCLTVKDFYFTWASVYFTGTSEIHRFRNEIRSGRVKPVLSNDAGKLQKQTNKLFALKNSILGSRPAGRKKFIQ
ncbi:MAG: hypothetical protein AB2693_28255 [Candidatus Thiodiazotropha sp.]